LHGVKADIRLHDLAGGLESLALAHFQRVLQLCQLDIDLMLKARPSTLLLGIVECELLQFRKKTRCGKGPFVIGIEVCLVCGDQETALAPFGILHCPVKRLRSRDDFVSVGHTFGGKLDLRCDSYPTIDLKPKVRETGCDDQRQTHPHSGRQIAHLHDFSRIIHRKEMEQLLQRAVVSTLSPPATTICLCRKARAG
jgi:hypothetical protein